MKFKTYPKVVPINGIEPVVIKRPCLQKTVTLGGKVELVCQIKCNPEVKVKWMIGKENNQRKFDTSHNDYTGNR